MSGWLAAALAALAAIAVEAIRRWRSARGREKALAAELAAARTGAAHQQERAAAVQTDLEEEIRVEAQARIDVGDPGARRRLQNRWATEPGHPGAAVPSRTPTGPGADPARPSAVRGRR